MAVAHGKDNIRINCICPGTVQTEVWEPMIERNPRILDETTLWYPLGRVGNLWTSQTPRYSLYPMRQILRQVQFLWLITGWLLVTTSSRYKRVNTNRRFDWFSVDRKTHRKMDLPLCQNKTSTNNFSYSSKPIPPNLFAHLTQAWYNLHYWVWCWD